MEAVGIICEYNPFHNGHIYHIQKTKEQFPHAVIVLVLNGYFLERGEISILSKEEKTKIALDYGADLVVGLPVVFGTQSADIFAEKALEILHQLNVTDVVFGSESNNIKKLTNLARKQFRVETSVHIKKLLKQGINYPTALSKAISSSVNKPNDLLGISYAKAILKHSWNITLHTILRTSDYHDITSKRPIVSASNIRSKLHQKEDISCYVPKEVLPKITPYHEDTLFSLLQYRILTDPDLSRYVTVDEGIESRLIAAMKKAKNIDEFVYLVKTKRYTYNKIHRMIIHLLLGFTKEDNDSLSLDFLQILGFNKMGKAYLSSVRKSLSLPNHKTSSKLYEYELKAAYLYEALTKSSVLFFEKRNKPIIKS